MAEPTDRDHMRVLPHPAFAKRQIYDFRLSRRKAYVITAPFSENQGS